MKTARGFDSYMAIVVALRQTPMLTAEVAELLGVGRNKAIEFLNELRTLRIVRRERQLVGVHGTTYRWFFGADAAISTQRKRAARPRANAIHFAVFFRCIQRPISAVELAAALGVNRDAANKHIARARANHGAVPIIAFRPRFGCHPTPLYQFAPGQADVVHVPRPTAEIRRESRQRRRAAEEARQRLLSRASNSSIFAIAASMAA
jgi:hypothetical protein